ncbi:MAG: 50S ribosomal protein L9 [Alphaproteobacteria bacterium]|nr:50S ribosomal protein L9 [Alphaproteobacteria bacterium]
MQVILMERVEKLGQMGEVVKVKDGYARNFLLPRGKAKRATKENIAVFETKRAQLEADNLKRRDEADKVGGKMKGLSVVLLRQASEKGQLYGSVAGRDVAEAVTAAGFTIKREQVRIDTPIKSIGIHHVTVVLHPDVAVDVAVNVARSEAEAETQADPNKAATAAQALFEREQDAAALAPQPETEAETTEET